MYEPKDQPISDMQTKLRRSNAAGWGFKGIWLGFLAFSVMFFVAGLIGWLQGHDLPTTTLARWLHAAAMISAIEPYLPRVMLAIALCGALCAWLAERDILDAERVRQTEEWLLRGMCRWGPLVIIALLVFSLGSGGWLGQFHDTDTPSSFFGRMPYADASGYFSSGLFQTLGYGTHDFGARRPSAQAARDLLVWLGGGHYTSVVLLQTALAGLALSFAAWRMAAWRGLWPAVAFVAFIYLIARAFSSTTLTEPIAMIVALGAIGILVDAIRTGSAAHALLALAGISLALSIRMGAMFILPLLILWTARLGADQKHKRNLLIAGAAVVLGAGFLVCGYDLRRHLDPARSMRLFSYSISYLTLLFGALAADVLVRS